MFLVGHVNKDGAIAGPKVMEHIVDTVLYFEGDKMLPYRILRGQNRYGSTNELGMFDKPGRGLTEIANPSQMLLEGRPLGVSGNCVACTMEGTRPILSRFRPWPPRPPSRRPAGLHRVRLQPGQSAAGRLERGPGILRQPGRLCQYRGRHCPAGHFLRLACMSMISSLLDKPSATS